MTAQQGEDLVGRLLRDIQQWEGQNLEFMEVYPTQASDIAKEIAAFATSNTGIIYFGVAKNRTIVGIAETSRDSIQNRISGICQKTVKPAIVVSLNFVEVDDKIVLKITVPKGSAPVYYSNNIPYVRNLTASEPATPEQVMELHRKFIYNEIAALQRFGAT
ncbi:MAG: ATP-binding protein [Chloroflexota bacterium]